MKITNEIKQYISREVNKRIYNKDLRPFSGCSAINDDLYIDYDNAELKEDALKKIKNRFNISDEILNNCSLKIDVYYRIRYKEEYENLNQHDIENKIIVEMQLNPKKFKTINDIDTLIDETIGNSKTKK